MENENKTITKDERIIAYYVIRGIDDKTKEPTSGIICLFSKFNIEKMTTKGIINWEGVYLNDNGDVITFPKLTSVNVVAECTPLQIDQFNAKLHEHNICIKTHTFVSKKLNGDVYIILQNQLFIENPDLVKYDVRGKLLTQEEFEEYELAEGESCHYYFDNGYSCVSTMPVDKDKLIETITKRLAGPYYYATIQGTTIKQDKNNPKTWIAETYIQKNTNYSEISNS